jgi:citrate lyase subunit beta/citryl-CoA lyase
MRRFRSILFVPALSTHLLAKAHQRGADALVIDLEDSIPPDRKVEARPAAVLAVQTLAARGQHLMLRVNADPALWRDDILGFPEGALTAVMLPKVESAAAVDALATALARQYKNPIAILPLIETPRGLLAAAEIAAHPAVAALGYGAEDYAAAIGVIATPVAVGVPAYTVVAAAHAFGRQCIGLPASIGDIADLAAFEEAVRMARAIGFTGSVCIHPSQVEILNRGFSPTEAELDRARRLVAADDAARAEGRGAFVFEGRLADGPIVIRARRLLEAAGPLTAVGASRGAAHSEMSRRAEP